MNEDGRSMINRHSRTGKARTKKNYASTISVRLWYDMLKKEAQPQENRNERK